MTDKAISQEALLQGLRDIHLPPEIAGGGIAQVLAAVAIGAGLALLIGGVLRLFSMRHVTARPATVSDRIKAARALPSEAQQIALLHLLKDVSPDRYQALTQGLYQPDGTPDARQIEKELRQNA